MASDREKVIGGLRTQLGHALDAVTFEQLEGLVRGIFDMERVSWAHCPDCRRKVKVDYPDYKGQAQAIALLADQALGKPPETLRVEGGLLLRAQRMAETMPIEKIPTAELRALVESGWSDEERQAHQDAIEAAEKGDWEPLRALGYENLSGLSREEIDARLNELEEKSNQGRTNHS